MIMEFIVSLILEGTLEAGTSKKVPIPLKILLLIIFFAIYAALIGIIIMLGINGIKDGKIFGAIVMFAMAALIAVMSVAAFIKTYKSKCRK
jgi:hypothetical protein